MTIGARLLIAAALAATTPPARAIYKCEIAGAAPVYQSAPCPAEATVSVIETEKERAIRAKKEIADRSAQDDAKRKQAADAAEASRRALAQQQAKEPRQSVEVANPQEFAESGCKRGIAKHMPYLEPVGEYSRAKPGWSNDYLSIRVAVRLSDSFRAAAVGVVECSVRKVDGDAMVSKIPM